MIPQVKFPSYSNAFYCPHCREVTRHIKVGFAEKSGHRSAGVRFLARAFDTFQITDLHHMVFGCQDWKCLK